MTTGHVFIAVSLDGFIARPDGGIDWLSNDEHGTPDQKGEDYGCAAFMARMDGIVMGRASFETVAGFATWPYPQPVIVLSGSLRQADLPGRLRRKVRLMSGNPREVLGTLAGEGWARAYVDGGETIRRFLRAGCIADMVITRLPVLIGRGRPLFGPVESDLWLTHAGTHSYAGGLVQSRYVV